MASRTLAFALLLILCAISAAARVETGFLDRTVSVSGRSYRYQMEFLVSGSSAAI
jgi:hypothetical protein